MTRSLLPVKTSAAALLALALVAPVLAQAPPPGYTVSTFATGGAIGATNPDSLAVGGGDVFVGFANNADTAGGGGASTIAEYTLGGTLETTYSLNGGNDGLRVDPKTGLLWVLQNQDGNAVLNVLDPGAKTVKTYGYDVSSTSSGYDDIVFKNGQAYLSATNPASGTDPVLYRTSATLPISGPVHLTPVLAAGNLSDTDALSLTPGGDLLLDDQGGPSPADSTIISPPSLTRVTHPGLATQSVTVLDLVSPSGKPVSVDDTRFAEPGSGQLLIADTKNNAVYSVMGPFTPGTAFTATKGSGYVGTLDLGTGVITPFVGGLGSPHGLTFAPSLAVPEPAPLVMLCLGVLPISVLGLKRRQSK